MYYGSHPGLAVGIAAGFEPKDPSPVCLIRMNAGENTFDQSYFVDLTDVAGGGVVGGLLEGPDDQAYVFEYKGTGKITAETWRTVMRGDEWAVHSIKLGDEAATYAAVPGQDGSTAYGSSFTTFVDGQSTPFLVTVDADFSAGNYFELSGPTTATKKLSFPGFPGHAINP